MKSNKWSRKNARKTKKNKGDTINTFDFNKNSVIKKTNKMNCSPMVDGETPTKETCYTKDILMKIKAAYNEKRDTNDQITTYDPNEIWHELKRRLTHCPKEDCWLKELKDDQMRKDIDELVFAPDQPPEWKSNPDEWLSNFDIEKVLKQYEKKHKDFKLFGPSAIDYDTILSDGKCVWEDLCKFSLQSLINRGKTKFGISFNLDKHHQPGSHWVSLFVDVKHALIFFYDSALNPMPSHIDRLKNDIIKQGKELTKPIQFKFIQNTHAHQRSNTECGMYSLFFIITFLTGKTEFKKNMTMVDKCKLFTKRTIPDKYVPKFRDLYFNT
jgi:hypothetical protein